MRYDSFFISVWAIRLTACFVLIGTFSGGNKRKLSLAVALVGGPRVLLLDEPSSGMCPLGRRMMWDTVERAASGLTLLLTTHAMDECEVRLFSILVWAIRLTS